MFLYNNVCWVSRKLFKHKVARTCIQTSSEVHVNAMKQAYHSVIFILASNHCENTTQIASKTLEKTFKIAVRFFTSDFSKQKKCINHHIVTSEHNSFQ